MEDQSKVLEEEKEEAVEGLADDVHGHAGSRAFDKVGEVLLRKSPGGVLITWSRMRLCLARNVLFFTPVSSESKKKKDEEGDAVLLDPSFEFAEVSLVSVTRKKHAFSIESKQRGLSFLFCAPSAEERERWLEALEDAASLEHGQIVITRVEDRNADESDHQESSESESEEKEEKPTAKSISICSYNVNFGMCQLDALGDEERSISSAMRSTKADVILLQETTSEWEVYLMSSFLACSYPHVLFRHFDTGETKLPPAGGVGILSKYPFTELALIDSPVGWFPAHLLLLHSPIDIQLLNLHLRPPITREVTVGSFQSALPMVPALSRNARAKECKHYSQRVDWSKPLVVCGDFNEDEEAPSCKFWTNKMNMRSALAEHAPGAMTWWWRLPGGMTINAHYDHIFYQRLRCTGARVCKEGLSDHYPVVAHFEATQ